MGKDKEEEEGMKAIKITLGSEVETWEVVAIVEWGGRYFFPWSKRCSEAAVEVGGECGCGQCHNCLIREAYARLEESWFGLANGEEWREAG